MLDSPYVRRCAVSKALLGIAFDHRSVPVFRHMDTFKAINPLVKVRRSFATTASCCTTRT